MLGCRPAATLIEQNHHLMIDGDTAVDRKRYQHLMRRLIYLSHTRPNITFAVSVMSQYIHDPRERHQKAAYHIVCYLKGYPRRSLLFSRYEHLKIEGYTDADWVGALDDRKSTSYYCIFLNDNLVPWRSKKQDVVTRFHAETEYRILTQEIHEVI
ncbi:secreted RxLR effector protein 161-like [Elaeis guineensis]|uniref:secreted RxLR effector protein 161-like n=1 Tax=Elaeis guineensis var. tenera TaxID=51953 RepID=UPI003C6D9F2B